MNDIPHWDMSEYIIHRTENDGRFTFRATSGAVFICTIDPSDFVLSPTLSEQYFKVLKALRSGDPDDDEVETSFYEDEAFEWLNQAFGPFIETFLRSQPPQSSPSLRPTLQEYYHPSENIFCTPRAQRDEFQHCRIFDRDAFVSPSVRVDDEYLCKLSQWTRLYQLDDVEIHYRESKHVLIRRPNKVVVKGPGGEQMECFFKAFGFSTAKAAKDELGVLEQINSVPSLCPPTAYVCKLYGVVHDKMGLSGMLFPWIPNAGPLAYRFLDTIPTELKQKWQTQIQQSLAALHHNGIVWGDAKAENVLICDRDNAWIIDFGGGYTPGWVDREKAGTVEGDAQGLAKIVKLLSEDVCDSQCFVPEE